MNSNQSNTKAHGPFPLPAASDLTGMEGRLLKITNSSGVPNVDLDDSLTTPGALLLIGGDVAGNPVDVLPLGEVAQFRATLKGTCNPSDRLVKADPTVAADKGKVRVLPATAGTYKIVGLAMETGLDGQLVLATPLNDTVTISA